MRKDRGTDWCSRLVWDLAERIKEISFCEEHSVTTAGPTGKNSCSFVLSQHEMYESHSLLLQVKSINSSDSDYLTERTRR